MQSYPTDTYPTDTYSSDRTINNRCSMDAAHHHAVIWHHASGSSHNAVQVIMLRGHLAVSEVEAVAANNMHWHEVQSPQLHRNQSSDSSLCPSPPLLTSMPISAFAYLYAHLHLCSPLCPSPPLVTCAAFDYLCNPLLPLVTCVASAAFAISWSCLVLNMVLPPPCLSVCPCLLLCVSLTVRVS